MINVGTSLFIIDNSGGKRANCIKVLRKSNRSYGYAGDVIIVSLRKVKSGKKPKKGDICRGVIVRVRKDIIRADGGTLNFKENCLVLVSKRGATLGNRVLGIVAREVRWRGFGKLVSIAGSTV